MCDHPETAIPAISCILCTSNRPVMKAFRLRAHAGKVAESLYICGCCILHIKWPHAQGAASGYSKVQCHCITNIRGSMLGYALGSCDQFGAACNNLHCMAAACCLTWDVTRKCRAHKPVGMLLNDFICSTQRGTLDTHRAAEHGCQASATVCAAAAESLNLPVHSPQCDADRASSLLTQRH